MKYVQYRRFTREIRAKVGYSVEQLTRALTFKLSGNHQTI